MVNNYLLQIFQVSPTCHIVEAAGEVLVTATGASLEETPAIPRITKMMLYGTIRHDCFFGATQRELQCCNTVVR